jgi:hypothetical protein
MSRQLFSPLVRKYQRGITVPGLMLVVVAVRVYSSLYPIPAQADALLSIRLNNSPHCIWMIFAMVFKSFSHVWGEK